MMPTLLLATHNSGKLKEFAHLMEGSGITLESLDHVGLHTEIVDETASTYVGNAWLKAKTIGDQIHKAAIADDSGIEVEALHGKPGVQSARYIKGSDGDRCRHMLKELEGVENRKAKFVCVIVFYDPVHNVRKDFRGEVHGIIATTMSGTDGFGYDPIFIPEGYHQTMAELGGEMKNQISHRARAIQALLNAISTKEVTLEQ